MSELNYDQQPEYKAMDEAIRAYFRTMYPEHVNTGWLVLGTGMRVVLPDDVSDAYKLQYQHAAGTSYHTMLGLLAHATQQFLNPGGDDE